MGMRKYKRQLAKAFMNDAGVGNVNRKMHILRGGVPLWRRALEEHARICRNVKPSVAKRAVRKIRKAAKA